MKLRRSQLEGLIKRTIHEVYEAKGDDDNEDMPEDNDDDVDVEEPAEDVEDADVEDDEPAEGDEEVTSLEDVPQSGTAFILWAREFVLPALQEYPNGIPAFHRMTKMLLKKLEDRELVQQEPQMQQRLGTSVNERKQKPKPKPKQRRR